MMKTFIRRRFMLLAAGVSGMVLIGQSAEAMQFSGHATFSGEVLAPACTIALEDRFQIIPFGEVPLRELWAGSGHLVQDMVIHLEHCAQPGQADELRSDDRALRIRFEGVPDKDPAGFRTFGTAGGVALYLQDARREAVRPGVYMPALWQRSYDRQVLEYRMEVRPDGQAIRAGDFRAALRFRIDYE